MHNLAKTVEGCLLPSSNRGEMVSRLCRAAIQRFGRVAIMVPLRQKEANGQILRQKDWIGQSSNTNYSWAGHR